MAAGNEFTGKYWTRILLMLGTVLAAAAFLLWPETMPVDERQKIVEAIVPYDVVILFNPGGWGNATLQEAKDFAPILESMQRILTVKGYTTIIVPYARTPAGFSGTVTGIREYLNSFRTTAQFQAKDMEYISLQYPRKHFILAGFSNGGGLTDRVMTLTAIQPNIYSVIAGVPGWYPTQNTPTRLVLNNNGQDPLAAVDIKTIAVNVLKAPYRWICGKLTRQDITVGRAFHFPGHEYSWDSPQVGPVVTAFLESHFGNPGGGTIQSTPE